MKTIDVKNTEYAIDIDNNRLVESKNWDIVLGIQDMDEVASGYKFNFNSDGKPVF